MNIKSLIATGSILSFAIMILGLIHVIATFTPLIQSGLSGLALADFRAIIYISLVCGTSFILSGLLLIMLLNKVGQNPILLPPMLIIGDFMRLKT